MNLKKWGLCVFTFTCLIAMTVCIVCDYVQNKNLTWSLITVLSVIAGWIILLPIFKAESRVIRKSMIAMSLVVIPFLAGLSAILRLSIIWSMGSCIAALSIMAAWGIYGTFVKCQKRVFLALAISILIVIPLTCGIVHISAYFVETLYVDLASDLFHIITTLMLSAVFLFLDFIGLRCHVNSEKEQG